MVEWSTENKDLIAVADILIQIFPNTRKNREYLQLLEERFDRFYTHFKGSFESLDSAETGSSLEYDKNIRELWEQCLYGILDYLRAISFREDDSHDSILYLGSTFGSFFAAIEFGICSCKNGRRAATMFKKNECGRSFLLTTWEIAREFKRPGVRLNVIRDRILTIIAEHHEIYPEQINLLNRAANMF